MKTYNKLIADANTAADSTEFHHRELKFLEKERKGFILSHLAPPFFS
jgi:hypothetical protein